MRHTTKSTKKDKTNIKKTLPTKEEVLELITRQKRPLRIDPLLRVLNVSRQEKKALEELLASLASDGELVRMPGGLWTRGERLHHVVGVYHATDRGGIVKPAKGDAVLIHPLHSSGAWHRDVVKAVLPPGQGSYGKVLEVLERVQKEVPAQVIKKDGKAFICVPTDRRLKIKLRLILEKGNPLASKLKPGLLISVHPQEEIASDLWSASLVNIFGDEQKVQVQEAIVKCNHLVPEEFPPLALEQAAALPLKPDEKDFEGREDWRHLPFVTIDGADARDFDDAIHVEKNAHGWILRVAIADVSHYVLPDKRVGSLNEEALKRGNSWYFPRSVEPMLPKELSNGLCSLRPQEDRLAVMVEMPFDFKGHAGKARFAKIAMRSAARLIYDNVASFFDDPSADLPENPAKNIRGMLGHAYALYKELARLRRERGTLDFDLPEPAYVFDASGRLEKMGIADRNDAHKLIEEFMIAANEAVATYLGSLDMPFLYRVHPKPESAKLEKLYDTLKLTSLERLPPHLTPESLDNPKMIQAILARANGTPQEYLVSRLCLRSMSQARYQPENAGHFGLASSAYCHFTSPIRRYADLLTHRALKNCISESKYPLPDREALAEIGEDLNKLEREAMECEREMARRLGCLALKEHEGKIFEGVISGVTEFGLFVEFLDIPTEGLIRLDKLASDWFELDQQRQMLVGQHSGQTWRLGQKLKVLVENVDLDRLEIRLQPLGVSGRPKKRTEHGYKKKSRDSRPKSRVSERGNGKGKYFRRNNNAGF